MPIIYPAQPLFCIYLSSAISSVPKSTSVDIPIDYGVPLLVFISFPVGTDFTQFLVST